MKTNRLGRTDLEISEVVLGAGYVGGVFLHAHDDERRAVLRTAIDSGINWIDTAPSYGDGQSETAIGWLLRELEAHERPQLSTKVTVDASAGDILGQVRSSLEASFQRLGVQHVPLLQLHNKLGDDPSQLPAAVVLETGGVLDAFDAVKAEGLIDFAGITALGAPDACMAVVDSGRIDSVQTYFNLINPTAGVSVGPGWYSEDYRDLMSRCVARDVGVLAIRIYAAGLLASAERHGREIPVTSNSDYAQERARADAIKTALADMPGTDAQKALRFVLDHPHVDAAVIGLATLGHLHEALAVPSMASLPEALRVRLELLWQQGYDVTV